MIARSRLFTFTFALALLVICTSSLIFGVYQIEQGSVWSVLAGGGSPLDQQIVLNQRLPRLVAALGAGAGLGLAGAIFQSTSRNPLGSPDVIGFTTGSATGALGIMLVAAPLGIASNLSVGIGAVIGGCMTAAIVLLLTAQSGTKTSLGHQMVLVGIAIGAMLASVNDYLLTRADLDQAEAAKTWLYGSLNAVTWQAVTLPLLLLTLCLPATLLLTSRLRVLELGDDLAAGLGLPVKKSLGLLIGAAVVLTALATSLGGPISFIALIAPQLASRIWRTPGIALWQSAFLGAVLLACADYLAAHALTPFQIPVGLVMGAIGGIYLVILLWRGK